MDGLPDTCVAVVHCVDTEGPIGGNVRRHPDGSREFYDNWYEIKKSLKEITSNQFRSANADSFGNGYMFNWFIMSFVGFKTNPKNRIVSHHDVYDNIKSLNTGADTFQWHHHHPPASGAGDQWSDDWDSSDVYWEILARRLFERHIFPEAFRAGGTIEDEKCSQWLEKYFMIDYSNRVNRHSFETNNLFDFNWHGAPNHWGWYHPKKNDLCSPGEMKRFVVKCIDAKSRFHTLDYGDVKDAFMAAKEKNERVILSYFSHDHRDMRDETRAAADLIRYVSDSLHVPYAFMGPREALAAVNHWPDVQKPEIEIGSNRRRVTISIDSHVELYHAAPFIFVKNRDDEVRALELDWNVSPCQRDVSFSLENGDVFVGVAVSDVYGNVSHAVRRVRDE